MNYLRNVCRPNDRRILGAFLVFATLAPAAFAGTIRIPVLAVPAQADSSQAGATADQSTSNSSTPGNDSQAAAKGSRKGAWEKQAANMRKLMDDLQLTEDQRQKVRTLMRNHRQRIMALRQDSSLSQDEKNQKLKAVRNDARKRFSEILTEDQKAKLKAIREQYKQEHQKGGDAQAGADSHPVNASAAEDDPAADLVSDDEDTAAPAKAGAAK